VNVSVYIGAVIITN